MLYLGTCYCCSIASLPASCCINQSDTAMTCLWLSIHSSTSSKVQPPTCIHTKCPKHSKKQSEYLERQCFYFNSVSEVHIYWFHTNDTRLHVCFSHISTTRRTLTSTWQQTCTNKAETVAWCTDQPLARTQRTKQSQWVILLTWSGVGERRESGGIQRRGNRLGEEVKENKGGEGLIPKIRQIVTLSTVTNNKSYFQYWQ